MTTMPPKKLTLLQSSSLISIGQLCDDECIVTFDKYRFIVIKNKDKIIEGYQEPTNGLWRFRIHRPVQNNKKSNIMEHRTSIKPMAPCHPRAYRPTSHQYLAIFIIQSSATQKTHPAPVNQVWSLRNMASTHSKSHFKVYPIISNHGQRAP